MWRAWPLANWSKLCPIIFNFLNLSSVFVALLHNTDDLIMTCVQMIMSSRWILLILLALTFQLDEVKTAKILAITSTPSPSHHIWNRALLLALAAKGHQVTVFTPHPEKTPAANYKEIVLEGAYNVAHEEFDYTAMNDLSVIDGMLLLFRFGHLLCDQGMASKGAQTLMNLNEKFDVIMFEITAMECYLGFVHKFGNIPVIGFTAYSSPGWASTILGNPDNPSYVPNLVAPFTDHMNFCQRIHNTIINLYTIVYRDWFHMPTMDKIAREHFGESLPSVSEIERNISVILVNTHVSMDYSRPLVPGMIPVGGLHITPSKPLPQDLQKYLDEAKDGAIFFSLGSNVRSDEMGAERIQALLGAFKELPQRILWKFESDTLPGQPENVKISKWLPQNDILGHPNVKLFITHSGLLSSQETGYHGVPVVCIPIFMDQLYNARKAKALGVGEIVELSKLSKDTILEAIRKVIYTPSYRENMKRVSTQFRDQRETPLERAIYWIEYVIRHKGAHHLRSTAIDMPWYQYLLLDVILVLALLGISLLVAVWLTLRTIYRLLCGKKRTTPPKTNVSKKTK